MSSLATILLFFWNANVQMTPTDVTAVRLLSRMNRSGWKLMKCAMCAEALDKWLSSMLDDYVTLRQRNTTLSLYSQIGDLAQAIERMRLML